MSTGTIHQAMPRALGYAMPAEWMPHRATWLSWPHNAETWPSQVEPVRDVWVQMAKALAPSEQVVILVNDGQAKADVTGRLLHARVAMDNVSLLEIPTVDVWMRDYGPTFVTRTGSEDPLAFNDWIFNGWGGKYPAYERDERIAKAMAELLSVPVFEHAVVLEGGSIEVNGAGTCLTTEQCLLNKNRNPHMNRGQIEQFLKDSLGVTHVIWLGEGIVGDDTDGHIDDIARFVNPTTVTCIMEPDSKDENHAPLRENFERLQSARDQHGGKFSIVALPCPPPIYHEGFRLPASYANFYIGNRVVLVPVFGHPTDQKALGILQDLFSDRKVMGLSCNAVVAGLGALHCVTQQEPQISAPGP